ncbi:MAG: histidine phosphatase family protein [Clostridiales bacterium]|nr:histidine phosphatase family protein [Clostridiales bacterium]
MIVLVRHGQTPYNAEHRLQGQLDIPLSDAGREQAEKLGERLKNEGVRFDALYSSRLKRAKDTARIIGGYLGLEPKVIAGVEEINFGCFQGHTFEEAAKLFPEAYAEHLLHGTDANAHGGETGGMVLARAVRALLALPEAKEGRALVVSHGAVIGYIRAYIKGAPLWNVTEFIPHNAETTELGEEELNKLGVRS